MLVGSCSELIEQVVGQRWEATDALVAVWADAVVAWQCSQCLVEQTSEQMAVGVDAVPATVAVTSLRQVALPHSTSTDWTARTVLLRHLHISAYHAALTGRRRQQ